MAKYMLVLVCHLSLCLRFSSTCMSFLENTKITEYYDLTACEIISVLLSLNSKDQQGKLWLLKAYQNNMY